MRRHSSRAGTSLPEILVALTITLVVLGIGSIAATRTIAVQSTGSASEIASSTRNSALATLARHLTNSVPHDGDLFTVHDTVLEFAHMIGVATVCAIRGDTLLTTRGVDSLPWNTTLPRAITSDDRLRLWSDSTSSWRTHGVRVVGTATGACGSLDRPWPGAAWQRITLDGAPHGVGVGGLIRVLQRERWSLLRSGDGTWSLALATWDAGRGRFGVPQPVLAPLNAPGAPDAAGLTVRAIDGAGATLPAADLARTASVIVAIRSAVPPRVSSGNDSVRINVPAH
jgi:Tfp pilus assembly protein PilV